MKNHKFNSEEEFAEIIVKWLKQNDWTVYQEVQAKYGSSIADIVAEKDGKYWIIECKLNFGFKVMQQADEWRHFANYVSIAVPYHKHSRFREKICKLLNIGVIAVNCRYRYGYSEQNIVENHSLQVLIPKIEQELRHKYLINILNEKHKTFAKAGNSYGQRLTPFKLTVEKLIDYVRKNNGCLLKEAIKNISHHYSHHRSANCCLSRLINDDIIKELYLERKKEGNKVYLKT